MKRLALLTALLVALAQPVAAQGWVAEVISATGDIFYLDYKTMHRAENVVRVWTIVDYKRNRGRDRDEVILSSKTLREYDCEQKRFRWLRSFNFESHMGRGEVVNAYRGTNQWDSVAPGTVEHDLLLAACKN